MIDSFKHQGQRRRLMLEMKSKGIHDTAVLQAINSIPRHFFLDNAFEEHAYMDKAFPIDEGQTISQPYTVALQSQLLDVKKRDKILEIGTGSGYQSAILASMGATVYTIERHEQLFQKARSMFKQLKLNRIKSYYGDGFQGLIEFAPFDKIIVTAGAETLPEKLKSQVKVGGFIIIPVGQSGKHIMTKIIRQSPTDYFVESFGACSFVPLLKGTNSWR